MRSFILAASLVFSGLFTSCSSEPGKYTTLSGKLYNQVDIPIDMAWQKSIETLNSRWEITANDTVERTLTVRTFYHDVDVEFIALTENTCEFHVKSKSFYVKPNKAAVHAVYAELDRALKGLQN